MLAAPVFSPAPAPAPSPSPRSVRSTAPPFAARLPSVAVPAAPAAAAPGSHAADLARYDAEIRRERVRLALEGAVGSGASVFSVANPLRGAPRAAAAAAAAAAAPTQSPPQRHVVRAAQNWVEARWAAVLTASGGSGGSGASAAKQ